MRQHKTWKILLKMTIDTWSVVLATIASPIIAIQVQKWLERYRKIKEQRIQSFRTLMLTRNRSILYESHITTLNAVPIDFFDKKLFWRTSKSLATINSNWIVYIEHLSPNPPLPKQYQGHETELDSWENKRRSLYTTLLQSMAEYLGYKFTTNEIDYRNYQPQGYIDVASEQADIRKGLCDIFNGTKNFPVYINNKFPPSSADQQQNDIPDNY